MAKRKSSGQVPTICSFVAVLLGIVAVVMMFLPAIKITDTETTYTGLQIAFGYEKEALGTSTEIFGFSFMNVLTYILAVVGVVFAILSVLGKGSKFASFISAGAFIVAGVFFFLSVSFSMPNETMSGVTSWLGGNIKDAFSLAIGSIIGGITCILAGICSLAKMFIK